MNRYSDLFLLLAVEAAHVLLGVLVHIWPHFSIIWYHIDFMPALGADSAPDACRPLIRLIMKERGLSGLVLVRAREVCLVVRICWAQFVPFEDG